MSRPIPLEFLEWQVRLRAWTMEHQNGAPHVGVAPLLSVRAPGSGLGTTTHSIICGILARPERLAEKTKDFRRIYEEGVAEGARAVYDRGIDYLRGYYRDAEAFDRESITTLLAKDLPVVHGLRADPECQLVFYVFDLADRSEVGRFRCLQVDARAELLESGPVYENVWWHNALFHGAVEDHVVVHFRHRATHDTRFGRYEALRD